MELRNLESIEMFKGLGSPIAQINISVNPSGNENSLNAVYKLIQKHGPEELEIVIKKKTKKRSNAANAFMWALIDKIASKLGLSRDSVYMQLLMQYGVYEDKTVPARYEKAEMANHMANGLGFIAARLDISREDPNCVIVREWKGTSQYTQEEFSRILDAVIEWARELEIDAGEKPNVIVWEMPDED